MTIIYWIVFGLVVGVLANFIMPDFRGGILGTIVLGIVGAVVGGYLGQMFFGTGVTGFNLMSIVVATVGAVLVLFLGRLLMRN